MDMHIPDELFELVFNSISEGVFTVDEHYRITAFNAAAENIIGIPAELAIGQKCHDVFKANICQHRCALKQTLETGSPRSDVRVDVLNAGMDPVPIEVSTAVLRDVDGRMIGGVEIFRDISDIELLRDELGQRHEFSRIIGTSPAIHAVLSIVPQVAQSDAAVLIQGQSGTGKELVAGAIHELSRRRDEPFIRVNCAALPDALLESELFGYVKGAFTGAITDKPGRFSLANRGTLFLDEIGDLSPAFQVKLLRVLEEGEFQPLGGTRTIKVDVRLICATNLDLEQMVREGTFREDLYYRIRVVPIHMPALAERRSDIPLLIDHFVKVISTRMGRRPPGFSPRAMRLLYEYHYPGNVRELRNILERVLVLCNGDVVEPGCLPQEVTMPSDVSGYLAVSRQEHRSQVSSLPNEFQSVHRGSSPPEYLSVDEATRLRQVLQATAWNRNTAAERLGISRTTLWRRMKKHRLV
ncbi:MAG: sigma 54-interacting transcriptional regulator [Deltaproteobacteria bacterium]|nr:sigma 54-interacting transcriptional regulator [Deltaproteobacteria bacterium]